MGGLWAPVGPQNDARPAKHGIGPNPAPARLTLCFLELPCYQKHSEIDPVITLLSHRHNDVSDLKISNLVQPTSVRPVTVSAISLHFRKLVVRYLEVPDSLSPPRSKCVTYREQFFVKN